MAERRINDRFREANRVAVTIISASGAPDLINRTFFCPTADLSRSGLRLTVHIGVPVGAELELRIAFLKPLRTFTHAGRVVWVRKENHDRFPYALGVEFTALEPAAEEIWE
ncbi:MAG: PilZ domain-containing protein, partial [Verrucomicrobia bacterium]|nr:PilZ domain-containing protein [Verrucomicrobiota bacterium]